MRCVRLLPVDWPHPCGRGRSALDGAVTLRDRTSPLVVPPVARVWNVPYRQSACQSPAGLSTDRLEAFVMVWWLLAFANTLRSGVASRTKDSLFGPTTTRH